jgi:hypothetical protein
VIRTQSIMVSVAPDIVLTAYIHREHAFAVEESGGHEAYSYQLVCPQCRKTWASAIFMDETHGLVWPIAGFCEPCGGRDDWHPVPGSILPEFGFGLIDDVMLAKLPSHLLKREFDLHIKAFT